MDQKASQGRLRLGDDLLDERLTVSHGGRTREGNERAEAGRQDANAGTATAEADADPSDRPDSQYPANLSNQYQEQDGHFLAKREVKRPLSGEFKLGKPNGRQT